jgi:hypothetical protein
MLLESDDDSVSINFSESSDSDVNYAQEENWNETHEVVEEVKNDEIMAHKNDIQLSMVHHIIIQEIQNSTDWTVRASGKCSVF